MKLPNFTRLLHGVCEHNTKILFFFLNLDAVLSVSTPESFGKMWHIYEFEGKQLFLALNTIFTFPTPLPSPPELRNFRSYSKFLSPHPPPHFYCLPSTTKTIESINVNGGEGGRTIEMWWCWKLVKLDKPPINSTWNLWGSPPFYSWDEDKKLWQCIPPQGKRFPSWKDNSTSSTLFTSGPMLLNQQRTPS